MASRLLLLRRGDHDSRLTEGFESLLDMESMCDVSITCGQYIIKAHRTVLSIFSPFFKRIFDSIDNPLHYPLVVIKEMPYTDLRAIIDLMYRGEVTVAQDQFGSLKKSAKTLEVSELSDIITSYEEKMDSKPKINFEDSITSSGRNTRKRGRPKRYCEESDEELKLFQNPTKRQQIIQSRQSVQSQVIQKPANKTSAIVKKPLVQKTAIRFVEDNTTPAKPQTATRGGHYPYTKPPTAVRGGHSAFMRPQTATRGGHSVGVAKQQIATRGHSKMPARGGRGGRPNVQTAPKTIAESFLTQESSGRRGRRGRPPRQSRDSESDLPLATSLPVSLPEPVQVDLGNIFPNYNLNDVTSSTSNSNVSIPITFETTIKREQDSDSEVECIMSGSSPLPSGVVDDNGEVAETQSQPQTYENEISNNTSLQPIEIPANNELINESHNNDSNELTVSERDNSQENVINDTIDSSVVSETESEFRPNIIIKTERNDSPFEERAGSLTHEPTVSSAVIECHSDSTNTDVCTSATTSSASQSITATETIPMSTPTIISLNNETQESTSSAPNVPIIRFIKTERISPPVMETSFQSIEFSSNQTENNLNDANETSNIDLEVTNQVSIQPIKRIKIERLSPTIVDNQIDISQVVNQSVDNSSAVTSSKNNDSVVEMSTNDNNNQTIDEEENENEIECTFTGNPFVMRSIKAERKSPTQETQELNQLNTQSISDSIECSSSGQQLSSEVSAEENLQNIQDIAFDCFFSNEEQQQMQTFTSEATTSSSVINTSVANNSLLEDNTIRDINNVHSVHNQNHQSVQEQQQYSDQQSYINNQMLNTLDDQQNVGNETTLMTNYSLANNNPINSPIHSDEECMLLDSPQQTGYEVTVVGSEANVGDDEFIDDNFAQTQ